MRKIINLWSYLVSKYNYDKHNNSIAYFFVIQKHVAIEKYLSNLLVDMKTEYNLDEWKNEKVMINSVIWTLWWGDEIPELVDVCLRSQYRNKGKHQHIIISKNNISQYLHLPEYILDKVRNGSITATHFSDIVRVALLKNYGGLWLDATVFVSNPIPECIFEKEYYTIKMSRKKYSCVSEYRWNGAIFAGKSDNLICTKLLQMFSYYWFVENSLIDYFLIDYFMDMLMKKNSNIYCIWKQLEESTEDVFALRKYLNCEYTEQMFNNLVEEKVFHKLSRHENFNEYSQNGIRTIWGGINRLQHEGL